MKKMTSLNDEASAAAPPPIPLVNQQPYQLINSLTSAVAN